jgi:uncharacterized protein YuzE
MDIKTIGDLEQAGVEITYEVDSGAGYLRLNHNDVERTVNASNALIDYDEEGNVVGIEFFA